MCGCADCSCGGNLNPLQFKYDTEDMGGSKPHHLLTAHRGDTEVGKMRWSSNSIRGIHVEPEHQRQGIATALWNQGQSLASENKSIPAPKHSRDRTKDGDAWARSVGGRLPRRV